ncbi:protein qui-1-like [Montipora foliosa]|uniref:protein qui-1-like n=2 Tax=Montipora foliosa TaxID=591990 RepID=UPI0035F1EFB9
MGIILSRKKNKSPQIMRQVGYNQLQPTEAPTINQNREASPEKPSKQDSHRDRGSLERNYEDEEQSEKSSDDEGKGKSDSEKEDSEKDDDQASKHSSSKNSSATASRKSSSSSHEDNQKEDEKTDENKDVDVTDEVTDNLSYEEKVKMAFAGDLDFIYPEKIKIVRIFTSSTFTDTSVERNTLMERVYPRLKSYCQERGYDFQVVDMRWGVRDESTDDHMTTELCMRELRACQRLSTGPNFITFLGQKYGYRPFPVKITASEFDKLLEAVENQDDHGLLTKWFRRDENAVPAQYLLQPITSQLPHYRDYENEELRKKASSDWWTAFERMQVVLRTAAEKGLDKESNRHKYYMSVTEDEIRRGIIDAIDQEKHCFWFKRVITDINDNMGDSNTGKFVDKTWGSPSSVDEPALQLLHKLKEEDLPVALPSNSVIQYNVKWHKNGIDPGASHEHADYIEKLCTDFYNILTDKINQGIDENQLNTKEDALTDEILQHGSFCRKKCELFHGRDEYLTTVRERLKKDQVVVLFGESGCGKTSLMAKIAMQMKKWLEKETASVIVRFIGTTPDSSDARSLMRSVCEQICKANASEDQEEEKKVPQDIRSLLEFFPKCLEENASSSKPLVLVLDSLDQLSDDDAGRELDWLPKQLPDDVYIVLSTLPGDGYVCLPKLQEKYDEADLIEVPKMPVDTAKEILDSWLKATKRQLQSEQETIVLEAFKKCPLPLYLKLSFDEASRWKSYTSPEETRLAPTIKGIIHGLLERVERIHGKVLVSQALAYITASKNGLTETELEDILSLDDVVLNDVYQYWTPPIRRLPPLLWIRIRSDIGDYLIDRGADGARVIYWYHRQFIEVARERYLGAKQVATVHSNISDYFLGKWSDGVRKPFVDKSGKQMSMDRLVPKQPLMFDANDDKPIFNLRKLSELPHHLLHSNQLPIYKQETLCNFEFLLAKVQAMSVEAIQQDFNAATASYPDDKEFELFSKSLGLSAYALREDPRQLPIQLIGRLHKYSKKGEYPFLKKVLENASTPSVPAFIPNQQCLTPVGGSLVNSISYEEFHGGIEYVNFTSGSKTIVTCNRGSEGLCLLYVDIKSGRRQRKVCFDESSTDVNSCWCAKISSNSDDIFLASGSSSKMYLINARTNKILQEYHPMKDSGNWFRGFPSVAFASNDELLVSLGDASVRIWETESGKLLNDIPVEGINVEEEFGSLDAKGDRAVYCVRKKKTVHVVDVKTGKEIRKIDVEITKEEVMGKWEERNIREIHLTSKFQLIVVIEGTLKSDVKVYNLATGQHILDFPDFGIAQHDRLVVTEDGKAAVAIRNNYELVRWDLGSGNAIVVARLQSGFGTFGRKGDFVATAGSDGILRIYDSREAVDEDETDVTTLTDGFADSIWSLTAAADNRHVIASCTVKMMPEIAVWDALAGVKVRSIKAFNFPQPLRMLNDKVGVGRIAVGPQAQDNFDHYKVMDFDRAETLRVLQGKSSKRMEAVGFIDKQRVIGLSRGRRNLKVWDVENGKVVEQHKLGQKYRIETILISQDGSTVICSQASFYVEQEETTVPLLAFYTKTHLHKQLDPVQDEQLSLDSGAAITEDGKYLLAQLKSDIKTVLWDTESGRIVHVLDDANQRGMVAISSKSMRAVTGQSAEDNGMKVWDVESGNLLYNFVGAEISKIFLIREGNIALTTDSKGYQPTSIEAWDLIKGRKLATFTVDTNPSWICHLGDHISYTVPASLTVTTLELRLPGSQKSELGPSSYGAHEERSEFKGIMDPCNPNDVDEDKDDDDSEIMQ